MINANLLTARIIMHGVFDSVTVYDDNTVMTIMARDGQ